MEEASRPAALGPAGWKAPSLHLPALQSSWQTSRSCHSSRTRKAAYTGLPAPFLPSRPVTDRRDSCSDSSSLPPQSSLESPTGEGPLLCCFPVFWPAAVSAIFKWLQLGTSRPAQQGSSRHPGLGSQLWKASPSHGCENSLSHWSQTQPTAGIRPSADSPFHRRPRSTWTLLIFLLAFFVGFHSERTANL